jgi:hypothetical protein
MKNISFVNNNEEGSENSSNDSKPINYGVNVFIENNVHFRLENVNITKCFSNFYPVGIYITENNFEDIKLKNNVTDNQKSTIKNSYFSQNNGLFEDPKSITGGVIVSSAKVWLEIDSTQFLNNSFALLYEG